MRSDGKHWRRGLALFALLILVLASACKDKAAPKPKEATMTTRPNPQTQAPVVAGAFYSADPKSLGAAIHGYLGEAKAEDLGGRPLGFMVPHAGHRFSGPVAAYAYQAIAKSGVKRFVIMGPAHRVGFEGVYVMDKDFYRTPLGEVAIDWKSAEKLVQARPWISSDPKLYGEEHSVEVQIPFLQVAAGADIRINVLVIGQLQPAQTAELAQVLNEVFPGDDVIFLASTDMSHGNYPPYMGTDQTKPVDLRTLELIKAMDFPALERGLTNRSTPMCGGLPVLTLMHLFKLRGGQDVKVLNYADSGDASGDHSKVVGYGAAAFVMEPISGSKASSSKFELTEEDQRELLRMARTVVDAAIRGEAPDPIPAASANLKQQGAAFVTLKTFGQLRGCIGSIVATEPLYQCVQRRAVDAALHDSRFFMNRLKPGDLKTVEIEISVLTPPERVSGPEEIMVGRDGVLLTLGRHRGVFLPQVPIEQGWDRTAYLQNLCRKAGMGDPYCYLDPDAVLERFQAIIFSEREMGLGPR